MDNHRRSITLSGVHRRLRRDATAGRRASVMRGESNGILPLLWKLGFNGWEAGSCWMVKLSLKPWTTTTGADLLADEGMYVLNWRWYTPPLASAGS